LSYTLVLLRDLVRSVDPRSSDTAIDSQLHLPDQAFWMLGSGQTMQSEQLGSPDSVYSAVNQYMSLRLPTIYCPTWQTLPA
jgi:hypothetical protein